MSKTNGLPTGISFNCGAYRWCVTYKGERITGSNKLLNLAIAERECALAQLRNPNNYRTLNISDYVAKSGNHKKRHSNKDCPTLEEAVAFMVATEWRDVKSLKSIKGRAKIMQEYLGKDTRLDEITTTVVDNFVAALDKKKLTGATINRYLSILSKILSRAKRKEQIARKPEIERRKETNGRVRFISEEEETVILEYFHRANKMRMYYAVQILLDTGICVGELQKLRKKDVKFDEGRNGVIYLYDTKNGTNRVVPLTARAKTALEELIRSTTSAENVVHEYYNWIIRAWAGVKKYMQLTDDSNFVPHILRHTCCTRLIKKNANLKKVQKWMGHSSIQTTMRYTHLVANDILSRK